MAFSRLRSGWLHRALELMRWSRFLSYALIAAAGIESIIHPPVSVSQAIDGHQAVGLTWALVMTISAGLCALGAALDRWVGEYVGLIPLSIISAVFGISAISRSSVSAAGGLFLIGFFWIMISRWQEVALLRIEADRKARENESTELLAEGGELPSPDDRKGEV